MDEEQLQQFKKDPRTSYLASQFDGLLKKEQDTKKAAESDASLISLAEEELQTIAAQKEVLLTEMRRLQALVDDVEQFPNEIVLELRQGAGGDEAGIFAYDLALMYRRYAERKGWNVKVLNESENPAGGYKEASFEIKGTDVYKELRFETGVHRIQRIPATEKSGRIHTSTASVAIMPIRKKHTVTINPADVQMEFSRSGGAGGQNVNKVETAVRIVHRPTGLEVRCSSERSQLQNREKAMNILLAKLERFHAEEEAKKYAAKRKQQIGTMDRSEKIRTYNVLQDRVTDHRIQKSWHNIEGIFSGNIETILTTLQGVDVGD